MKRSPVFTATICFLTIASVAFLVVLYNVKQAMNPPPSIFQNLDHFSEEAKNASGFSVRVPVDHVYIYTERNLRGGCYLRYHFLNPADFEKERQRIKYDFDMQVRKMREFYENSDWQPTTSEPYDLKIDAMKSWWDWKDHQPDCEVYRISKDMDYIFDKARHIVYIARYE
jgi:hypothetical protein